MSIALLLLGSLSTTLKAGLIAWAKPPPEGSEYSEPTPAPLGQSAVSPSAGSAVADGLGIAKLALTASGSDQQVYNGEVLTYTLVMTNQGTEVITNLLILDQLPNDALFDIQCSDDCHLISQTQIITDPFAGPIAITTTAEITWLVVSLDPGASITRQIWGTAGCQADGAIIENTVFVNYWQGGQSKSGSAGAQITARARSETGGIGLTVSSEPVWCSAGMRGVYDLDWGDFDGDGDFDLAVASVGGTAVYRNDQGRLTAFWETDEQAFSARWIDAVLQNGLLELAVAGEGPVPPASGIGSNYVYRPTANGFEQVSAFSSESAIFRLAVGDYNSDGKPDLAAANLYEPGTGCLVRLYNSNGSGNFTAGACSLSTGDLSGASSPHANALAWGDYDNDGDPDLAVGGAKNGVDSFVEVRRNSGGVFGAGVSIGASNLPAGSEVQSTDLAWGDYNGDGYLDLAAGFMRSGSNGEARIYPNNQAGGFGSPIARAVSTNEMPVAIAWGDLNKDGAIDLSIADEQPKVYYGPGLNIFGPLLADTIEGHIWVVRLVDYNQDGTLDLTFSSRDAPSALYPTFAPFLNSALQAVHADPASSVAWGDSDGDGDLDLLFGAGPSFFGSRLYDNDDGAFSSANSVLFNGFGPRSVVFGDMNGDYALDIAFGVSGQNEVFLNGNVSSPDWQSSPADVTRQAAWADADGDGDLDLLAGNNGANRFYLNSGSSLESASTWSSPDSLDTRAIAWGDYNRDTYLDFAVANYNGQAQVYCNNRDNTFTLAWSSGSSSPASDVAWADYDGDGDLDLAVANKGAADVIYQNLTCQNKTCGDAPFQPQAISCPDSSATLDANPTWTSAAQSNSTSLAWGDWNNDGDLDLAVGNDGQNDYIYDNLGSRPDDPQLVLRWLSDESYPTTDIAWGDVDGDGDPDLAAGHESGQSGFYRNTLDAPSHLRSNFATTMPLPYNPVYLSIARPGQTPAADFFSSAELLGGATSPTVTIVYRLFDPNGTRDSSTANAPGRVMTAARFEYSLDGGGTWLAATPSLSPTTPLESARQGVSHTFLWNARADQAIGDDVRFRITVIPHLGAVSGLSAGTHQGGWPQRAVARAVSPPFRVRGVSCAWPEGLSVNMSPAYPKAGEEIRFEAILAQASGLLDYIWDFGDGSPLAFGPVVHHTYSSNIAYQLTLTVRSSPCPIVRELTTALELAVGGAAKIYLPIVLK